jgi:hypothetical protein
MPVDRKTQFAGKAVLDWEPGDSIPDPTTTIPRISATDVWGNGRVQMAKRCTQEA